MSVSRWKIMACTLGLSLGGLAISAGQSNDRQNAPVPPPPTDPPPILLPEPKPPVPDVAAPTALPTLIPAPPAREFELDLPKSTAPAAVKPTILPTIPVPDGGTVYSGVPLRENLPMPREETPVPPRDDFPPPTPLTPVTHSELPPIAPPTTRGAPTIPAPLPMATPPVATNPLAPPPVPMVAPPMLADPPPRAPVPPTVVPDPPANPFPPAPIGPPPVPPTVLPATPPSESRPVPPPTQQLAHAPSNLKMLMRLGDGKPRFEIRTADSAELLFKVYGEKIEMQSAPEGARVSPIAGVTALGKVRFTGPNIEGTCDHLMVLSGTGEVLLKGNVHVKTKRGKTWSEMTTEKMIYQIGASSLTAPTSTTPPSTPINSSSFNEQRFVY